MRLLKIEKLKTDGAEQLRITYKNFWGTKITKDCFYNGSDTVGGDMCFSWHEDGKMVDSDIWQPLTIFIKSKEEVKNIL